MNPDTLIITIFCLIDDQLKRLYDEQSWRGSGFAPRLSDAEVICLETVGELLGLDTDTAIIDYFRRHYADWFPALGQIHRTTSARQSANLRRIKERLRQALLSEAHAWQLARLDSFPVAVCRFARASRCRLYRGFAAYGKDHAAKATIYGFRLHVRVSEAGFVTALAIAPANESDSELMPQLVEQTSGYTVADRNYWSPLWMRLVQRTGIAFDRAVPQEINRPGTRRKPSDRSLSAVDRNGLLATGGGFSIKRIRVRDEWHLANRVIRKVLAHTLAARLNCSLGNLPLQFAKLLAD